MDDLTTWLHVHIDEPAAWIEQQIDDDERVARDATRGPWAYEPTGTKDNSWGLGFVVGDDERPLAGWIEPGEGEVIDPVCMGEDHLGNAEHIARWDPARVLAEVGAKRRRLKVIRGLVGTVPTSADGPEAELTFKGDLLLAVGLLHAEARPYADCEGYRPEWWSR